MKYKFTNGETNVAKRPDIRQKISDNKWQGYSYQCQQCGVRNRCSKTKSLTKKFCSWECRGKYTSINRVADKSFHWKGGRTVSKEGYIEVSSPGHPNVRPNGYVLEHRLVMEKHLGRYLQPEEIVHHINYDKQDNRIDNLLLTSRSEHAKIHYADRKISEKGTLG